MKKLQTALITGASSGLGASFARIYAKNNFNLVLTARRKDKLEELATELIKKYNVKILTMSVDLSTANAAQDIYDKCSDENVEVDVLVNNAGIANSGFFHDASWSQHDNSIQLMITTPSQLTYLFQPAMVDRGWGRILNVSSFVGLIKPTGTYTLYGATKSYLIKFSEALSEELKNTGVKVLALCPGFFKSEFHDDSDDFNITSKLPEKMFLDIDNVAKEGYDKSMEGEDVVYINGRIYQLMGNLENGALAKIRNKGNLRSYADRLKSA